MRLPPALLLLVLLAGCIGDPDTDAARAEPPAATLAEAAPEPAVNVSDSWEPYAVPVAYEGKLGPSAMVCGDVSTCEGRGAEHDPAIADPLVAFSLTLTWTPRSPASEKLALTVDTCDQHECKEVTRAVGTSPLAVEVPDAALRGNPLIRVRAASPLPAFHMEDDATFRVEGIFTARVVEGRAGFAGHDGA